jgi:hypothetical protein
MAADRTDALYALPLEEFVAARGALAKELRKEKRREEAQVVAALPKPTRPAWIVNQLARTEGALVAKLIECAEALAEAQEAAVSGAGARDLRAAARAERQAVDRLVTAARELRPEGRPPSTPMLERVRVTLQAAAADEALRALIRAGRLAEEPAAGGAWPMMPGGEEPAEQRRPRRAADAGDRPSKRRRGEGQGAGARAAEDRDGSAAPPAEDRGRTGGRAAARQRARGAKQARTDGRGRAGATDVKTAREQAAADGTAHERAAEQAAADRAAEEAAQRRREVRAALDAARKRARDTARERDRARRDAERATERLERLVAEADSARAAAESAEARRAETEAAADESGAEVARLEAELRRA